MQGQSTRSFFLAESRWAVRTGGEGGEFLPEGVPLKRWSGLGGNGGRSR